jgi:hypothetical protein
VCPPFKPFIPEFKGEIATFLNFISALEWAGEIDCGLKWIIPAWSFVRAKCQHMIIFMYIESSIPQKIELTRENYIK